MAAGNDRRHAVDVCRRSGRHGIHRPVYSRSVSKIHVDRRCRYPRRKMEAPMQYKTLTLELLMDRPELYEQLRLTHLLLPMLETLARELKASHETWKETLAQQK